MTSIFYKSDNKTDQYELQLNMPTNFLYRQPISNFIQIC